MESVRPSVYSLIPPTHHPLCPGRLHPEGYPMEIRSIDVFSQASNQAVVRMPGRTFPGIVVQGDSLAILVHSAEMIHELAETTAIEELVEECRELLESLKGRLQFYEQVIAEHGILKPY